MQKKCSEQLQLPTEEQIRSELERLRYKREFKRVLGSTLYGLLATAAFVVLIATLVMPVLQIYGSSMTPTLEEGEVVVSFKVSDFDTGDVVAFYYNNKILVKRVIAGSGKWVDIKEDGTVCVDNVPLDEPYVSTKAKGECDIVFPYQVPDGKVFVMGDHRETSVDSRSETVGCVPADQIVGRIEFRIWPFKSFGKVR